MLDMLFSNSVSESLTFNGTIAIIISALLLGVFISLVYMYTHKKEEYNKNFTVTLIMLPAIIAMIILLIGNNVARAFSLAGAFSLIRFRSAPGDSKDIAYVFFTLGTGLACGMGYIGYAALFAFVLCLVMIILNKTNFGGRNNKYMRLKILVPEDMEYEGAFEEILNEYTSTFELYKIKTAEYGTLFELSYNVVLKDMKNSKRFMDKLRCKNGNLNIALQVINYDNASSF
ncbi:hypothetical protein OXPF_24530 [Oxobacter pfennigii]|uniref:DUF4956 domain-containing protein n=1 Tax=Oxobacter pfennigii TaxID=36849 RepID=A0A0P8YB61_9CLOT|nr:DUF4956 domain-containing protein [Oxobacter pfennigii]KPU44285.1 hypothetical protein OXPF_24530 [Oxobacter pfennigii]